jgi:hypothetical protein
MRYRLAIPLLLFFLLAPSLGCERKKSFLITVDGNPYLTKMNVAKAYLEDMHDIGFGGSGRVILNFPTPRKGDVMAGYGTGLILRLDPNNIEAGDEFFLGIYEEEGEALIELEKDSKRAAKRSSLDADTPLDWQADTVEDKIKKVPDEDHWKLRTVEASLEASPVGSSIISSFTTRKPGGGIHIEFDEFKPTVGGKVKGKIIEATLIGRKIDRQTYQQIGTGIAIMKIKNFSFDTNFQEFSVTFGN